MTQALAITDGETVLATIDINATPQRAFEALNSAEVERWWGAPGLYRFAEWDHPTLGRQVTKVTYRFDPIEGGTRVTVRQDEFGSPAAAREHAGGWERTLYLLQAYLIDADGSEQAAMGASAG